MIILTMSRHYDPYVFECSTVQEAAQMAVRHLNEGLAYPMKIEEDGQLIWDQDGPTGPAMAHLRKLRTYQRLRDMPSKSPEGDV